MRHRQQKIGQDTEKKIWNDFKMHTSDVGTWDLAHKVLMRKKTICNGQLKYKWDTALLCQSCIPPKWLFIFKKKKILIGTPYLMTDYITSNVLY